MTGPETQHDRDPNVLLAQAFRHHQAGHLAEAEAAYRRILADTPHHAATLHLLGVLRYTAGDLNAAIRLIEQAIGADDGVPEFHNNLAHMLTLADRIGEAQASLGRALALKPDYADARNNLGNIFKKLGKLSDAVACYQDVLAQAPRHAEACANLGTVFLEQGRLEDATLRLRQALVFKPDCASTYTILGTALVEQGNLAEALTLFQRAVALAPDAVEARISLGRLLARSDHPTEAREQFEACRRLDPEDRYGISILLAGLGDTPPPDRMAGAFINRLYANRGHAFGQTYRGAELVAKLFERLIPESACPDVLDAGCGTGGVGDRIHGRTRQLDGVDLSPDMLRAAKDTGRYHHLHCQDLVTFLEQQTQCYDVVTCAATLIHFGNLQPVFAAVAQALRPNGWFLFTVFPYDDTTDANQGYTVDRFDAPVLEGCFAHRPAYLTALADTTGFTPVTLERDTHTFRGNLTRTILLAGLRRTG